MSFSDEMTKELEKLKKKQQEIDGLEIESPYAGSNSHPQNNDITHIVSFDEFKKHIDENYPLLAYEYHISEGDIHHKTPREFVTDMENASSQEDYDIYAWLISSSMDMKKDKNFNTKRRAYEEMMSDPSIAQDIKFSIKGSIERAEVMNKGVEIKF